MAEKRHHFEINTRFGPSDLFRVLRGACDKAKFKEHKPDFDFDWMSRAIEISALSEEGARMVYDYLEKEVAQRAGAGQLLPGMIVNRVGRVALPIGVLIQTPDVYTEVIVDMLSEIGVSGRAEGEDGAFSVPVNVAARAAGYEKIVHDFPLPPYLVIVDKGIVEAGQSSS